MFSSWLNFRGLSKLALIGMLVFPFCVSATAVRMQTSKGNIDIQLYDASAPLTTANFLNYVKSGAYNNSIIHRNVPGFVIQGGGYDLNGTTVNPIPANVPVTNEFSSTRSNVRGTIAMAKVSGNPNSATNQWFFNLADNSSNLNSQNGGFTVFGYVLDQGMTVVDAIAALPMTNQGGGFTALPYIPPLNNNTLTASNYVVVNSVTVIPDPTINLNGSSLNISMSVDSSNLGQNADWWFVAYTPWGHWYYYAHPGKWIDMGTGLDGVRPAYQGALQNISNLTLFTVSGLPSGQYVLYFGVDTNMNGLLDYNQLYYSNSTLNVP